MRYHFFILSAFVIRHSFDKYKNSLFTFYKLRLFRIYFPFLFSVIFSITLMLICVHWINPDIIKGIRQYNTRLFDAYNQLSISQVINTVFLVEQREFAGATMHTGLLRMKWSFIFIPAILFYWKILQGCSCIAFPGDIHNYRMAHILFPGILPWRLIIIWLFRCLF